MGKRISTRFAIWSVALAAVVWAGADLAFPGDALVAKTLLESGKKALAGKKYDEAIPLFRKALIEDPTVIEAVYWRAQVHEKAKDDPSALAAYREFLALYTKKAAPTAEDQKLKPLAEKRVEALAVADREFQKLEEKYVADLLALSKAKVAGDPGAALGAANRILEIDPKNAEALALRNRLGETKAEDPYAGVETWRDLVKDQAFHSDALKYSGGVMTLEVKNAGKLRSDPPTTMGTDYAGEMEFRFVETFDTTWYVGFSLGETKDGFYSATLTKAQVRVLFGKPKQRPEAVADVATAPADHTQWHRLGFVVHGARIQVYVDGEKIVDEAQGQRVDFSGDVGISLAAGRAEFRSVRVGSFK